MGLFDTFKCDPPVVCDICGHKIEQCQSKSFGSLLETYSPGEIIKNTNINYGIIEESIYCNSCKNDKIKIYLIIWQNVYVGYDKDKQNAIKMIESIDRLSILEWLDKCQIEKRKWEKRFYSLYNSINEIQLYLNASDKQNYLSSKKHLSITNIKEHIQSDDPLLSVLKEYENIIKNNSENILE